MLNILNKKEASIWLYFEYSHINSDFRYIARGDEGVEKTFKNESDMIEWLDKNYPNDWFNHDAVVETVKYIESDEWNVAKAKAETVKTSNIWMVLDLDANDNIDDLGMICVQEMTEFPGDFAIHIHPHLKMVMHKMAGKDL